MSQSEPLLAEHVGAQQTATAKTQLRGKPLVVARGVWAALVVFSLGLFVANLPHFPHLLAQFQIPCSDAQCTTGILSADALHTLHSLGISVSAFARFYFVIFIMIPFVMWGAVGLFLAWRKSDDWMALLVSLFLILFQASVATEGLIDVSIGSSAPLIQFAPAWFVIFYYLCQSLAFPVLALFPNGRFVPRWMPAVVIVFVVTEFLGGFVPSDTTVGTIGGPIQLASFACLAGSMVYRYRRGATLLERQQIKWLAFGITLDLILNWIGPIVLSLLFPQAFGRGSLPSAIYQLVWPVTTLILPIAIGIAILRYRLWDIDTLINRALVYGVLTSILGALYIGLILGLETVVGTVGGGRVSQQPAVLVISTLAIIALFQPLRARIRRTIDRRFYRSKYDAARTLEEFAATLRNETDLPHLREHLLEVVHETMQPAHVSLWLRQEARSAGGAR